MPENCVIKVYEITMVCVDQWLFCHPGKYQLLHTDWAREIFSFTHSVELQTSKQDVPGSTRSGDQIITKADWAHFHRKKKNAKLRKTNALLRGTNASFRVISQNQRVIRKTFPLYHETNALFCETYAKLYYILKVSTI